LQSTRQNAIIRHEFDIITNFKRVLMGTFSIWHWLIVLVVVLVLFGGKGKVSSLMGDFGKGLKSFKKGMAEDPAADNSEPESKAIDDDGGVTIDATAEDKDKAANG
jgi:sec-independent protein translocase protein TatA